MRKIVLIIVSLLSSILFTFAQPKVSTTLSADSMMIGDQVTLGVEIEKDQTQEVGLPQFKENKLTDKIELVGTPTVDTISVNGRQVKIRVNYIITCFDAGSYIVGGFPIVIMDGKGGGDTLKTQNLHNLKVTSFEIDTTKQEIYDIKQPIDTPFTWDELWDYIVRNKWPFAGGTAAAILVGVGIYFWLRRRRKQAQTAKPKEPAHITAMRQLAELRNQKLWQSGKVREYYSELTDIARVYLNGRYQIDAMEMTTPEIISAIQTVCSAKEQALLKEFFSLADLAKFAKWQPDPLQNDESYDAVYNFVEQTKIMMETTQPTEKQ